MTMVNLWRKFVKDQTAQDLTEFALLIAFVVVAGAALFQMAAGNFTAVWTTTNHNLQLGVTAAS